MVSNDLMADREKGVVSEKFGFTWNEALSGAVREAAWENRQSVAMWIRETLAMRLVAEGRLAP